MPASARAQDLLVHPDPTGWYFGARAIAGASHADPSFVVLPPGAIGSNEDSYSPQENFGAGLVLGYRWSAWGVPLRTELDGSVMYRHDSDMHALFPGDVFRNYQNNLRIWDLRLSLLADVYRFGWGRLYAGGGLGGAYLESDVEIAQISAADSSDWKVSPSLQAGLVFDRVFGRMDMEVGYRVRWFGDVESGVFPTGEQLDYDNLYIHEIMLGFTVPFGS